MQTTAYDETFHVAEELLELAKELGDQDGISPHCGLYEQDFFVRIALHIKSVHFYQSILVLLQTPLSAGAEVVSRALFETSLAQEFLCRNSVRLWEYKNNNRSPLNVFGQKLTRHFRTELYIAHCNLDAQRWLDAAGPLYGRKDWNVTKKSVIAQLAECEAAIGADWMRQLRKTKTYTGLSSIRQLAYCLGPKHRQWYNAIYKLQSQAVHASDPRSYVAWTSEGHITEPDEDVYEKVFLVLSLSTLVFINMLGRFTKTFEITEPQARRFALLLEQLTEID